MRRFCLVLALSFALPAVQCSVPDNLPDDPSKSGAPAAVPAPAPAPVAPAAPARANADPAVRVPIDGLASFGRANALVTLVAFTDYECPYCAKAEKTIAVLRSELGDDLRVVVASRPLPIHDHAPSAAKAFLAADAQGKGEAMHARLFADRGQLDDEGIASSARAIGLDMRAFEAARNGGAVAARLARADAIAQTLGVNGTPTFYVNGRRIMGARPIEEFRAVIEEELAKARALVAQGVAREDVYAKIMAAAPPPPPPALHAEVDEKIVDVRLDDAPFRGPARAPVTVAVFSDFECPFCVRLEATLKAIEEAYPGKVRIAFRHMPLPMHEHARLAAKAAVAAESQGRFWQYHDVLVTHRDALDRESLRGYARDVGLDLARFDRDLADPKTEKRVSADEMQAASLNVTGTPVAFVNGRRVSGAQPLATFKAVIDRALVAAK